MSLKRVLPLALFGISAAIGVSVLSPNLRLKASATGKDVTPMNNGTSARLHNGWVLNPVGTQIECNDMPSIMLATEDGKFMIGITSGWRQHVMTSYPILEDGRLGKAVTVVNLGHTWRGAAIASVAGTPTVFVSGAAKGTVQAFAIQPNGALVRFSMLNLPRGEQSPKPYVGEVIATKTGELLVIDENGQAGSTGMDLVYRVDPVKLDFRLIAKVAPESGAATLSRGRDQLFIADHAGGSVQVIRLADGGLVKTIPVGVQPVALHLGAKGTLYCVNSGSDSVSVIDPNKLEVTETIKTALTPKAPLGSNPVAITANQDESKLFVVNAGNNNVCLIERKSSEEGMQSRVQGFIPTGRYPVSVALSPDEKSIWIGTGKGLSSAANGYGTQGKTVETPGVEPEEKSQTQPPNPKPDRDPRVSYDYIMTTLKGSIAVVAMPDAATLRGYTKLAIDSWPYRDALLTKADNAVRGSVLPSSPKQKSPFEHVVYIIKENRTYDQVFGDMPKGNGDPKLTLYGREVSPNHHKIAEEFVLLDNTYCDGEVSQDGWEWSCAANDSDWNTKATVQSYSARGNPPGERESIRPRNQYLWELADQKGLSYISYGAKTFKTLYSPTWKGNFSKEWNDGRLNNVPDYKKADIFIDDLKKAEQTGKWKNLIVVSITDDHTSGTRPGAPTPNASVASNDLALGKMIEAITKSKFWPKTAVFVIEDDAQNGPDHVDAHRTVALVVSPYTKRGSLDSTMYTSTSLLRSIELCLGLGPLSQYDAGAAPMFSCFTGKLDLTPYSHVVPKIDLDAKNPPVSRNSKLSMSLDFSDVDKADFGTLNKILWEEAKPGVPYPAAVSAFRPSR